MHDKMGNQVKAFGQFNWFIYFVINDLLSLRAVAKT